MKVCKSQGSQFGNQQRNLDKERENRNQKSRTSTFWTFVKIEEQNGILASSSNNQVTHILPRTSSIEYKHVFQRLVLNYAHLSIQNQINPLACKQN